MIIFKLDIDLIPPCDNRIDVSHFKASALCYRIGCYLSGLFDGYTYLDNNNNIIMKLDVSEAHARIIEKEYPFIKAIDTIYFKSELGIKIH